ncbi:hypothetical protein GCM10009574_068720 [Streptomyces asiaticus]|uniref:Carrier domain-containing protein n=3 Tax=Streptomyces rhizosphaericus TaxID=114699 RepID=A0ABN1S795_9ACTN
MRCSPALLTADPADRPLATTPIDPCGTERLRTMETQTALQKEIREFVLSTISEEMNHPLAADEISDDSPMGTGGIDIDSLGLIELLLRLERRFDVKFPDSDIEQAGAMNLGDLINDVVKRGATA